MSISFGSVLICIFIIAVLYLYSELILCVDTTLFLSKSRLLFWIVILLCIRTIIPFNFPFTMTIPIKRILYPINQVLMYPVVYHFKIFNIIFIIWILGISIKLVKFMLTYKRNYSLVRQAATIEHPKKKLIRSILSKYLSKKIEIAVIMEPISPGICGIIHPILLMPDHDFSNEELDMIIQHEVIHYNKHDMITKAILEICTCFYWWNPVMYLLKNRFYLVVEMANDYYLICNKDDTYRYEYMRCLINCSKYCYSRLMINKSDSITIPFIKNSTDINVRINRMLKYKNNKPILLSIGLYYIAIIFIIITGILVVPESYYIPPEIEENTMEINSNNSYLIENDKGYDLYIDNKYVTTFSQIDESLSSLPVYQN